MFLGETIPKKGSMAGYPQGISQAEWGGLDPPEPEPQLPYAELHWSRERIHPVVQ